MKGHKWFAALYDRQMASAEKRWLRGMREEMVGTAKGRILEIGAGTGANFPYYRDDAQVIATEPDPYMLKRAEQKARELGKAIELREAPAEELPFDDDSFDVVITTLVMCSVNDQQKALSEIKRVLKPGGEYRFYEHVRYENAFGAFWQDVVTPMWGWFGAGCHPNRDTGRSIREAGFGNVESSVKNTFPPIPPFICVRPQLRGVATR